MMRRVRKQMLQTALAKSGKAPARIIKPLQEFGLLMGEEVAMECWSAYFRSNFTVLAVAGGWMQQPDMWRHDMTVLYNEYVTATEMVAQGRKPRDADRPLDTQQPGAQRPPTPGPRRTFNDLLGGTDD
jgi:hypothetical protein